MQAQLARRHGISTSQLWDWRSRYKAGQLVGTVEFSEVVVAHETMDGADDEAGSAVCPDLVVEVGRTTGSRSRWDLIWMRRRSCSGGWHDCISGGCEGLDCGCVTDMRRGMNTLALQVQQGLGRDPYAGEIFCFRGRKGDLVKILWHDGVGTSLYLKRLEAGKFIWPTSGSGEAVAISAAQLGYLLEGIDWRNPRWTQRPKKGSAPAECRMTP